MDAVGARRRRIHAVAECSLECSFYKREVDRVIGRPSRDLWLPALIGLVGVLASLAIWGVLVTERREQLRRSTE